MTASYWSAWDIPRLNGDKTGTSELVGSNRNTWQFVPAKELSANNIVAFPPKEWDPTSFGGFKVTAVASSQISGTAGTLDYIRLTLEGGDGAGGTHSVTLEVGPEFPLALAAPDQVAGTRDNINATSLTGITGLTMPARMLGVGSCFKIGSGGPWIIAAVAADDRVNPTARVGNSNLDRLVWDVHGNEVGAVKLPIHTSQPVTALPPLASSLLAAPPKEAGIDL